MVEAAGVAIAALTYNGDGSTVSNSSNVQGSVAIVGLMKQLWLPLGHFVGNQTSCFPAWQQAYKRMMTHRNFYHLHSAWKELDGLDLNEWLQPHRAPKGI